MGKLVTQIACPSCHHRLTVPRGQDRPALWFDSTQPVERIPLIYIQEAMGGQGRGVKGKDVKAKSGFVPVGDLTLRQAFSDPTHRQLVTDLYRTSKALASYLESIGVR